MLLLMKAPPALAPELAGSSLSSLSVSALYAYYYS